MLFGNNVNAFNGGVNAFVENTATINNNRAANINSEGNKLMDSMKKGEFALQINNLSEEQQKMVKEYDSNNDGFINNQDSSINSNIESKLDKLIAVLQTYNSPFRK